MRQRQASRSSRTAFRDRLILWLVVLGITTGFAYAYSQRNVHHIHLSPGQTVEYRVNLPLQRTFHSKSYVQAMGLPVICLIKGSTPEDQTSVTVTDTGHGLQRMWARISLHAELNARPGKRLRLLDFTINGVSDWPQVQVYVHVK